MVYIWGKQLIFSGAINLFFTGKILNFGETFQIQSQVLLSVAQLTESLFL